MGSLQESESSLNTLWSTIDNCRECQVDGRRVIHGFGKPSPILMVIGFRMQTNGEEDEREKVIGKSNLAVYEKMLRTLGLPWQQVYCTTCVKCVGVRNAGDHLACAKYLAKEISIVNPRIIVTMGEKAYQSLVGKDTVEWVPNQKLTWNGKLLVTLVSPDVVVSNQRYEKYWLNALSLVKQHITQPRLDWW